MLACLSRYDLNSVQTGLVVSLSLAGALAGSLIALGAGNKLGRKTELLAASLFYGGSRSLPFHSLVSSRLIFLSLLPL
eukprot:scaffold62322_cov16-Tisochrysis_lutea.AAC.1